ncbi:hypothetical protein K440DRAFT_84490 [Wilcoxina mikolae CBS 423.85]|nr:hypothetical protein K440DRAFT_84490 [Wilcoxina mikolae CBS 423.85]
MSSSQERKGPSKQPTRPLPPGTSEDDSGLISNIANSASTLVNSLTRPLPSTVNSALASSSSSSSKATSSTAPSTSSWSETATGSYRLQGSSPYSDFRTRPDRSLSETAEAEFTYFASNSASARPRSGSSVDGSDVAALLAGPLAASEVYMDDDIAQAVRSVDISHPAVVAFAECEDPVEFLQRGGEEEWAGCYTEKVETCLGKGQGEVVGVGVMSGGMLGAIEVYASRNTTHATDEFFFDLR